MNAHRPTAGDDAEEDGAQREQDHKGDGSYDPMGGTAVSRRLVVEALTETKPEGAAVAVAVAITAATSVARIPAAGISASVTTAAASPAAKLGEGRVGECGWLHFGVSFLDAWCGRGFVVQEGSAHLSPTRSVLLGALS